MADSNRPAPPPGYKMRIGLEALATVNGFLYARGGRGKRAS